jgi:hypothetical protein
VDSATKRRNPSCIFMPQCELRRRTPAPVLEYMQIRMAGASSADLNQDFSGTGYWGRYIDHLHWTASADKPYRFHSLSCLDGGQAVKDINDKQRAQIRTYQ